jgi:plastocyanin
MMPKVLVSVAAVCLLLSYTSCTKENPRRSDTKTITASATPTATSTSTPTPAPTTATVKGGSTNKWTDDASGTSTTTIKVGGTVTWSSSGGIHSLEAEAKTPENGCDELDASKFDSDNFSGTEKVTRNFNTVGTFGYHCGRHGGSANCKTAAGVGMSGVIKVVP